MSCVTFNESQDLKLVMRLEVYSESGLSQLPGSIAFRVY